MLRPNCIVVAASHVAKNFVGKYERFVLVTVVELERKQTASLVPRVVAHEPDEGILPSTINHLLCLSTQQQ